MGWASPSSQDCFAGCEPKHQRPAVAKRKWQDAMFRVNTAMGSASPLHQFPEAGDGLGVGNVAGLEAGAAGL